MRRPALAVLLLALALVPEVVSSGTTAVLGVDVRHTETVPLGFPVGWYDQVYKPSRFADMAAEGMTSVLPYGSGGGLSNYLNAADAAGVGVFAQIDPNMVKHGDVAGVRAEVDSFKGYTALRGWYLADEPTSGRTMSPATGVRLYNAIKLADPVHPVAIAFNASEDPAPYVDAMDVLMWDYYPLMAGSADFSNLGAWHTALVAAAKRWRPRVRFVPIIQAFGPTNGRYTKFRLPTASEERYMVVSALQTGVDGLFFWARYAADPVWRATALDPLMSEIAPVLPAVAAGPVGRVRAPGADVTATLFRDPSTKRFVLLVVNNVAHGMRTTIALPAGLRPLSISLRAFDARVVHL